MLADVEEATACLDPEAAADAITGRTRFVIPVHLFGQLADMRRLQHVADRHGLQILEDAAQAHDAGRDGRRAGAFGAAAAFSFYPGKNLGAIRRRRARDRRSRRGREDASAAGAWTAREVPA